MAMEESMVSGQVEIPDLIQPFLNMKKLLEDEIEVLRFRINVDAKQNQADKAKAITEKETEIDILKQAVKDRDDKIDEVYRDLWSAREERQEVRTLTAQLKEVECKANKMAEQNKALLQRVDDKKEEYQNKEKEILRLKEELKAIMSKLSEVEEELEKKDENAKLDKKTITILKRELENTNKKMERKMDEYESEVRQMRKENAEIKSDLKDIKRMLELQASIQTVDTEKVNISFKK